MSRCHHYCLINIGSGHSHRKTRRKTGLKRPTKTSSSQVYDAGGLRSEAVPTTWLWSPLATPALKCLTHGKHHQNSASKGREHGRHCRWPCPGREGKRLSERGQAGQSLHCIESLYDQKYWLWFINEMKDHWAETRCTSPARNWWCEVWRRETIHAEIQFGWVILLIKCSQKLPLSH